MSAEVVVRRLTEAEEPAALDLIFLAWPEIPRESQAEMIRRDPWRAQQRSYGAFLQDQLISHARFHCRPVAVGACSLDLVGVCEVTTHPDHRRRGLGHRVLSAALGWMREAGYPFVALYTGVNAFYEPLGWATLDLPIFYLPLASAPRLGAGRCEIERPSIFELPSEIPAIYAQAGGRQPLALQRTPEYWRNWPHWAKDNLWFGLLDNRWTVARTGGRVVAYGGLHWSLDREGSQSIREAGALPGHEEALFDVFDDLVSRARAVSTPGAPLELSLPSDHPYVRECADRCEHARSTRMMVQPLDLSRLLRALAPELRTRAAGLKRPFSITLSSPLQHASLSAAPGEVSVSESAVGQTVELNSAGLTSLVLGYRSAADLSAAGELQGIGVDLDALDVLFPCLHSHYWQLDHF